MQVVRHLSYFVPAPPGIDPKKLEGSQDPGKLQLLRVRPNTQRCTETTNCILAYQISSMRETVYRQHSKAAEFMRATRSFLVHSISHVHRWNREFADMHLEPAAPCALRYALRLSHVLQLVSIGCGASQDLTFSCEPGVLTALMVSGVCLGGHLKF